MPASSHVELSPYEKLQAMTNNQDVEAFKFVDGLRGIAALQVVVLHYCAAFLPVFARAGLPLHFAWEYGASFSPLFLIAQGYVAVYIFFVMSGFVLAGSFIRSEASLRAQAMKRSLRLYPPVVASLLFSAMLMVLFPTSRQQAVHLSMSTWLEHQWGHHVTALSFAKEVIINSMLVGYGSSSIFSAVGGITDSSLFTPLVPTTNAPLWTLHLEFWGSLALLAMTGLRRMMSKKLFVCSLVVAAFFAGTSFLSLFVAGFALYLARHAILASNERIWSVLGAILICGGLFIAFAPVLGSMDQLHGMVLHLPLMHAIDPFQLQCEVSAIAIFAGVLLSPMARRILSKSFLLRLGKISFSLYLTHFAILLTLGCAVFQLLESAGYLVSFFASLAIGMVTSLLVAIVFERVVDRPAVRASRRLPS